MTILLLGYKLQVSITVLFQLATHSERNIPAYTGGINSTLHIIPCLVLCGKETVNNVQIVAFKV
jgi:hypothetical protein